MSGSCSRKSNSAPLMCAPTNLSPQYGQPFSYSIECRINHTISALSVLGNNLVNKALQPPPALLFVSTCFTIGVQFLFFILFIATAFAGRLGLKNRLERPRALAVTAGIGVLGSLGGTFPPLWPVSNDSFSLQVQHVLEFFGSTLEKLVKTSTIWFKSVVRRVQN